MAYAKLKYDMQGDVAVITLADPSTLNALTVPLVEELIGAFGRAAKEARCAVLTGEGRGFSSGANLTGSTPSMDENGLLDAGRPLETHFNRFVTQLRDLPIPFVTAVNGPAAGVGCAFALLGDIIVAAESAYFLQAFRRIGLVPDGSSTYLLPRMIGRARAMEMMLLGEKVSAAKALEWGMINRCVPDTDLIPTTMALATELATGPMALGLIRRLCWDSLDTDWSGQLHAERMAQRDAGRSRDFIEGVQAFAQKRPARFKGA